MHAPVRGGMMVFNRKGGFWIAAILLVWIVACIVIICLISQQLDQQKRDNLLLQAKLISQMVDTNNVGSLNGTESDLTSTSYIYLKEQLSRTRQVNKEYRFLYLMGRGPDGRFFFYVDSEPANSKDYSPPGQVYEDDVDGMRLVYDTGAGIIEGPSTDRWGTWVSALVPLTDPDTGRIIAVLGMDVDAKTWANEISISALLPVGLMLALLATVTLGIILMHSQVQLRKSEERFRNILEDMNDSYIEVDLAGKFTLVNSSVCRNLGYTKEELIGNNFRIIVADRDEEKALFEATKEVFNTGEPNKGFAFKARRKDGSTGYGETAISLIRDEHGNPVGFRNVGRDVTERKQLEQKLLEMATHDALTALPNRRLLYDRFDIATAIAKRSNKKVAIISLDLDKFKIVNDKLGHDIGDKLLVAAADRLSSALRKSDTVARMGGDEYVLLLSEIEGKDDAIKVAEKILEDFRQAFNIDEQSLNVTMSIGIAIYPDNGIDIESLLKKSDQSLYNAKGGGRNRFAI
jgi:diguanylate cyclase (GGDEF)-like protein/PAS domain S-box-containing protein